jgi:hypothetical protein
MSVGIALGFVVYLPALFFPDSINSNWLVSIYYGGAVAACFWLIQKALNLAYKKWY